MKKHFFIILCFMTTLAWGQVRPGTGPSVEAPTAKELSNLIVENVSDNSKECGKSLLKFHNLVEIQTYISLKNVAADGNKNCSELEPTVSHEVRCLFKGFPARYLNELIGHGEEDASEYFRIELKLDHKEAKGVWEFYKRLDKILTPDD